MKYTAMPSGMWALFGESFAAQLTQVFGLTPQEAKTAAAKANSFCRSCFCILNINFKGCNFPCIKAEQNGVSVHRCIA